MLLPAAADVDAVFRRDDAYDAHAACRLFIL